MLGVESRTALSKYWWMWCMEESCLCVNLVARKLSRISCLSSCLQQFPEEGEKWERAGRGREELLFILRRQAATPPSGLPSSQTETTVALDDYKLSRQHNASEEISISLNTFTKSFINILLEIPDISRKFLKQTLSWLLTSRRWGLVPLPGDLPADGVNLDFNCLKVSFIRIPDLIQTSTLNWWIFHLKIRPIIPSASPRSHTFQVDLGTSLTFLGREGGRVTSSDRNSDIEHFWGLRWVPWPQLPLAVTEDSQKS